MNSSEEIVTDALGFRLEVAISVGDFPRGGRHRTYEAEDGRVPGDAPHAIQISKDLTHEDLHEVIGHEAYHLFYSIRHLITVDEETEAEVFGQLLRRAHAVARQEEETRMRARPSE